MDENKLANSTRVKLLPGSTLKWRRTGIFFCEAEENYEEDLFEDSEGYYDPEDEEYILLEADDKYGKEE